MPPFKAVLTHGFIVDGDGRKMSKSLGNVISPLDVIDKSGADIIRLWAAAADYSQDISISDDILARTSDAYRRMRNTFRFLLSNLSDFEPEMAVPWDEMPELDRYALVRLGDIVERVTQAYDDWKFHTVYHTIFNYCVDRSERVLPRRPQGPSLLGRDRFALAGAARRRCSPRSSSISCGWSPRS